jgi:hypothetical protein
MANITQEITEEMERFYGRLGDAQSDMLKRILADQAEVKEFHITEIWKMLNKKLASAQYKPNAPLPVDENLMENLFQSGDSYPDIFSSDPDDIDMGNFL